MKRRESKYDSQTITIRRVAKVTSGGKRLRFSAMVAVGDRNGTVGVGLGRGVDTRSAVEKATRKAEKTAKKIQLIGDTIPHELVQKKGAAKVMLRPARTGTGVIAGSSVRTVLELCGVDNVYGKILGSSDLIANAYCTFEALVELRSARVLAKMNNMRERLNIKEQLDKERKAREELQRKKYNESQKGNRNDNRGGRGGNQRGGNRGNDNRRGGRPDNRNNSAVPKQVAATPVATVAPAVEATPAKLETEQMS